MTRQKPIATNWAIITGGSSGIGLALAERLARRGCHVVIASRNSSRLAEAASAEGLETLTLDVTDAGAVAAAMGALIARLGPPAWLVTSAGEAVPGHFLDQPLAEHAAQWNVNYLGTLNVLHALAPAMTCAGRGQVILISSAAALGGFYGYAGYAASKWAVRGLGEVLGLELGAHGVRVLTAFPPDTDTPQLARERALRPAPTARFAASNVALSPGQVADAILRAADSGRARVAPGAGAAFLLFAGPVFARYLAWQQRRLLRRHPEDLS